MIRGRAAHTVRRLRTRGWFTSQVTWGRTAQDFVMLLRTVYDLKLRNHFWNFPFKIFGLWLTTGNKLQKVNPWISETTIFNIRMLISTTTTIAKIRGDKA